MDKSLTIIIEEMRQVAEITIRKAGDGKTVNLANLTVLVDSWRFSLEKIKLASDAAEVRF